MNDESENLFFQSENKLKYIWLTAGTVTILGYLLFALARIPDDVG